MKPLYTRVLTGLAMVPVALAFIFVLPSNLFLVAMLGLALWAAVEMVHMFKSWAPEAPYEAFLILLPVVVLGAAWALNRGVQATPMHSILLVWGLVVMTATMVVLWGRTAIDKAAVVLGFLAFALPYLAVPVLSLYYVHRQDTWKVFVLFVIVGIGDTAAFFVGSRIGRHKMSPHISPNKSWEGAIGGWCAALISAAVWAWYRYDAVSMDWLIVAAVTSLAAQLGDLVESLIKRGAGVKDSANLLPGHGGIYDRIDALLLAAPVFALALWALGLLDGETSIAVSP